MTSERLNSTTLIFFVNGKKVIEKSPDPECTLLTYLRESLRLCGTKLGCGEGGCGACTVMISRLDRRSNEIKHSAVNACLTPLCALHGCAIITIEGIGSTRTGLHPVQERLAKAHGSQCGFCTPGIVMSMYSMIRSSTEAPSMKDLEEAFQGNLCRCTGYRPILEGYKIFTKEFTCSMGDKCCKLNVNDNNITDNGILIETELFEKSDFIPLHPTQEPIFPPELQLSSKLDEENLMFQGPRVSWHRPTTLERLVNIKASFPDAKLVVGNTEIGVEMKFKHMLYPVLVSPLKVTELNEIRETSDYIFFGASVSLSDIEKTLRNRIANLPEYETRFFSCIVDMLQYFAGKQIRNVASLGGNIMTSSPISDLNPILTAGLVVLEIVCELNGQLSRRNVRMDKTFFTGYRKNVIASHEIIVGIRFPKTTPSQYVIAYKQARRRDDDIAIANAAINVTFEIGSNIVESIQMAFGGMAATTIVPQKSCDLIVKQRWNRQLVERIAESLYAELPLDASAPGGMIAYRRALVTSLFFKAYLAITRKLISAGIMEKISLALNEQSGADNFETPILKSAQLFERTSKNLPPIDPIGRPKVHVSAFKQVTGEAIYVDDIPRFENELYLALVLSKKANAKIISIDASAALSIIGVRAFYSNQDLTREQNVVGPHQDEEVFASEYVKCQGQIIGAIVADNQALAQRGARAVVIEYEELNPIIITIEQAIEFESYFPNYPIFLESGNIEEGFRKADFICENICRTGAQEHFYLETQGVLAVPRDSDEIEIISSTQHPTGMQKMVAHVLSIPEHRVFSRAKRLGGGFGGKESRSIFLALPTALACQRLRRPVRMIMDRDEDMATSGTRHPFLFKYKVGCTKDGKITACTIECYNNAGWSMDLSYSVLEHCMRHATNCYFIPNIKISGWVCRTNLPSNTAFRGFGAPQAMFSAEHIIRDVARMVDKDYVTIMRLNFYKKGDLTFYKQILEDLTIERCFNDCLKQSNYYNKREEVSKFNAENRWRKRGISIVPTKYGISFAVKFLTQSGVLLIIYTDGSVLLSHGGVEIGQGLHTKMIQCASKALGIPFELIHISETGTDKVPNTSPTAASLSSDLNGMAVLDACRKLNERLQPIKEKNPQGSWKDWINSAYMQCISLSATGFYSPDCYDPILFPNNPMYNYFTTGVGVSVVEIDCLTGDHQVVSTDIVMDIGSSLNPAIDIGQIEGAFMQGYGLFTLEEWICSPQGTIYTRGPGMYKIPGFANIPGEFNVSLITGAPNPRAVYSSKAVGEPPLFIGSSVYFAIKEAIAAAREETGRSTHFRLDAPATSARIRMACQDEFTQLVENKNDDFNKQPWSVVP